MLPLGFALQSRLELVMMVDIGFWTGAGARHRRAKMADHATPNLPSADLDRTEAFYARLGFEVGFKDDGWMVLSRGGIFVEFVPLDVDPRTSIASCCFRVDELDALYASFAKAGLPDDCWSAPRLNPPVDEHGMRIFALIDPDGNLVRCIQN